MPTKEQIDRETYEFLRDLREAEKRRDRERSADQITSKRVLEAVQDLSAKVDVRFGALEQRVTGVEARATLLETRKPSHIPSPMPRSYDLGKYATDTGSYKIPQHELDEMLEKRELAEDGKFWRALKEHGVKVLVGVLIVVTAALVMSVVSLAKASGKAAPAPSLNSYSAH